MRILEKYKAKRPERIMFGDPWDFENYKDQPEIRDKIVVNHTPSKEFVAGIVLEDKEDPDAPGKRQKLMAFYFAPEEDIEVYMNGKMYSLQKADVREIVIASGRYIRWNGPGGGRG